MKLIFIGVQGSGKGTQAKVIAEKLKIAHISTGDLLRSLSGKLKEEADSYMLQGSLVPDEFIIKILKESLSQKDCQLGFILDGFPRNIKQALALDNITKIDKVIEIHISDSEAIKRVSSRISCKNCGSVFNELTNPPKKQGICDKCHSKIVKRADDTEEAMKKRLETYHSETKLILAHYKTIKIDGEQDITKVTDDILEFLS